MAIKLFESWDEVIVQAKADARSILKKDAEPYVKKVLRDHIQDYIYGVYEPKHGAWVGGSTYQRRKQLGKKIEGFYEDDELLVTSVETASKPVVRGYEFSDLYAGSFLEMLASGKTGIWKGGFARPAVEFAQESIDKDPMMSQIIEEGIRRYMGDFDKM